MKTLRIIARVMSALIVGFALAMFIGEGMQSAKRGTGEPMTMNAMIGLTLAGIGLLGLALAWKWEMAGGIICVVAFIVLFIVNIDALLLPMLLFPANGLLFIAAAYWSKEPKEHIVDELAQTEKNT
jgi:hypothetical protein